VYVPTAFANPSEFQAEISRVSKSLAPQVVRIDATLGYDWTEEPAAFFMVILADGATQKDQLYSISQRVSETIENEVDPIDTWGVIPYFNFRSASEQVKLDQLALAR
jgi:hypothetical protein